MEDPAVLLERLGVALAIGLLVGIEQHWRERADAPGSRTAGVRTYGLFGLLGGIGAALAQATDQAGLLLGLMFLGLSAAVIRFRVREAVAEGSYSMTSVAAAQAVFGLGALAVLGHPAAASGAGVALAGLLASREVLHRFVERLSWAELRSAILLLAMTLVAEPLLPDRPVPQLLGVNPARVWLLAVMLAAVSFSGYLAVRLIGAASGRLLAGAAGGLLSSTSVAISYARSAARGAAAGPLIGGALAAGAVSCLRTLGISLAIRPELGLEALPPLLACGAVLGVAGVLIARRAVPEGGEPAAAGNPFELLAVLQMALLLAAVGVLARLAARHFGAGGVLVVALFSGLADVDAVTLSVAGLVPGTLGVPVAATAVVVAVASNVTAKAAYGLAFGGLRFGGPFALVSAAGVAAGGIVWWAA